MDSEKLITSLKMKKGRLPNYLLNNFFIPLININKFSALLSCKKNVLDSFDVGDFFQIFFIS